jgi:hypothetical protein
MRYLGFHPFKHRSVRKRNFHAGKTLFIVSPRIFSEPQVGAIVFPADSIHAISNHRFSNTMKISAALSEDIWHNLNEAGAYEWWYFDATDASETYSFVAIWYSGFPFSPYYLKRYNDWLKHGHEQPTPLEHAAFSFNFYEDGKEVVNFIKEGDAPLFAASTQEPFARFEKNEFFFDAAQNRFTLRLDFEMPLRRKSVKAEIHFTVCPIESAVDLASLWRRPRTAFRAALKFSTAAKASKLVSTAEAITTTISGACR